MSLELPFGIAPVNPVPVDAYSGPYTGVDLSAAVSSANSSIASGLRFQSMEVRIIVSGTSYKYWYNSGIDNTNLVPFSAGADVDLTNYATTGFVVGISGDLQSQITSNDGDISTLQTATGVLRTDIDSNDVDISALQTATGVLRTDIDSNDVDISALQTATGVLRTDIDSNDVDISALQTATGVLRTDIDSNDVDISALQTATGVLRTDIDSNDVDISALQTATGVLRTDIDSNDVDISALQTATGVLRTDIDSNDVDISALQTATGVLRTDIDSNDVDISALQTATGVLRTDIDSNDVDISALQTATGVLRTDIDNNDVDISALQTATGVLRTDIDSNDTDISTVSGLLYDRWFVSDGTNSGTINSLNTLTFAESGQTSIAFNSGTNTLTIGSTGAGGAGGTNWNVSVEGDSTNIGDGETVEFTGQGSISLSRSANTVIISGAAGGSDPTGTASGVAFFGDDNYLTSDPNFYFDSGNQKFYLTGLNIDSNGTIVGTNGEYIIKSPTRNLGFRYVDGKIHFTSLNQDRCFFDQDMFGVHDALNINSSASVAEVKLFYDDRNVLAQRYGTDPQEFRIYHSGNSSVGDPTNYERLSIKATGYNYEISPQVNGGTAGSVVITNDTSSQEILVVKGAASQSANLQEWKRSDDQHIMSVDPEGNVLISGGLSDLSNQVTMTIKATGNDSRINLINYLGDTAYVHMQGGQRSSKFGQGSAYTEFGGSWSRLYAGGQKYVDAYAGELKLGTSTSTTAIEIDGQETKIVSGLLVSGVITGEQGVTFPDGVTQTIAYTGQTGGAGSDPTGTASGIAFFGDDNNLTESINLTFNSGTNDFRLYDSNDGSGNSSYMTMNYDDTNFTLTTANEGTGSRKAFLIGDPNTSSSVGISLSLNAGSAFGRLRANNSDSLTWKDNGAYVGIHTDFWPIVDNTIDIGHPNTYGRFANVYSVKFSGDYSTLDSGLNVSSALSTDIPLVVQGAASQIVNLQEWQDSSTTVYAAVDSTGAISGQNYSFGDGTTQTTAANVGGNSGELQFNNGGQFDGAAGLLYEDTSTGNILEVQDSDGNVLMAVSDDASGSIFEVQNDAGTPIFSVSDNDSGTLFEVQNESGTAIFSVSDSATGVVFDIQDADGNELFSVSDTSDTNLTLSAQAGQTGNLIDVLGSDDTQLLAVTSGGGITFPDGVTQTIAYTGAGGGSMSTWDLSVTGDSTTISDGETITFSGQDAITTTRDGNTVIISGAAGGAGSDPTGTASGVAFFGDDNLLTDDSNFYWNTGSQTLRLSAGSPPDGTSLVLGDNYAISKGNVRLMFNAGSSNTAVAMLNDSGKGRLSLGADGYLSWTNGAGTPHSSAGLTLYRDAADTLAQRRGSQAQEYRIYHSGDTSNYERLSIKATGYNYEISPQVNGGTAGSVVITNDTSSKEILVVKGAASQSANLQEWQDSAGTVLASVDNTGNISGSNNLSADGTLTLLANSAIHRVGNGARIRGNSGSQYVEWNTGGQVDLHNAYYNNAHPTNLNQGRGTSFWAGSTMTHQFMGNGGIRVLDLGTEHYQMDLGLQFTSGTAAGGLGYNPNAIIRTSGTNTLFMYAEDGVKIMNLGEHGVLNSGYTGIGTEYRDLTARTGIFTSGVQFPDGVTQTVAYTGQGGGSTSPGGSDTYVQFNDGGSFGGDANFTYDKTNSKLTIAGVTATGFIATGYVEDSETNLLQFKSEDGHLLRWTEDGKLYLGQHGTHDIRQYIQGNQNETFFRRDGLGNIIYVSAFGGYINIDKGGNEYLQFDTKTTLRNDDDHTFGIRNGSNPYEFRIYHSGDTSNYERLSIKATGYNYEISPQVNGGTAGSVVITNDTSSKEILIVKGAASQSANLQEWQDSAGTVKASINQNGYATLNGFRVDDNVNFNGSAGNQLTFSNANTTFDHQGYLDILIDSNDNGTTDYFRVSKDSRTAANILLNVDNDGNISGAGTGIFNSGVQFPDGVTQTVAYTGQGGGGSTSPGGSDTYVQFNDGGSFGGDANFTWNTGTDTLTVSGSTLISNTGTVFEVTNTGGTTLFAVEDSTDVQVIVAAQVGQTSLPFEVRDEFDITAASIDVSGNISGNEISFGDGTTQTTAAGPPAVITDAGTGITMVCGTHENKYLRTTADTAVTITFPSGLGCDLSSEFNFEQAGSGQITVTGEAGVTINSASTTKSFAQFSVVSVKQVGTDVYTLFGDTASF